MKAIVRVLVLIAIASAGARAGANVFLNPPNSVDDLRIVEGPTALLRGAQTKNVVASGNALQLPAAMVEGSVTLAPIVCRFPFNEAIPSWNGTATKDSGFRVWMRAGNKSGWTPWFLAGTWGGLDDTSTSRIVEFPAGKYDLDSLILTTPMDRFEVRVDLVRANPSVPSPAFRLFAVSYSNTLGDRRLARRFGAGKPALSTALKNLATTESQQVAFRSQVVPNAKWIGRICAPASMSMAASRFNLDLPTQQVAEMLYDPASDLFGVWHRSIQGLAQEGIRGYMTRFRNWDDVRAELARGSAVSASIRFKFGEIQNPPRIYEKRGTEGHIVTLVGFAPGGKVLVHDSARKDYGMFNLWDQDQLAKAWFDKGGVAFVFTGKPAGH